MGSLSRLVVGLFMALSIGLPAQGQEAAEEGGRQGEQLVGAIRSGSVAAVRRLLDRGVDVNVVYQELPAVVWAIREEKYYVVRLLVERGAEVNAVGQAGPPALFYAIVRRQPKIAELLVHHGADLQAVEPEYGMSPLQVACSFGQLAVVELLLVQGANPHQVDCFQGNTLEEAAFGGYRDVVSRLRKEGLTTRFPLHVAAGLGQRKEVERLLQEGRPLDQPHEGWKNTPLMFAVGGGHLELAQFLVERGAKLQARNVLGGTPLHFAANYNRAHIVKWLLTQEIDINARDYQGRTPRDWAGSEEMVKLLQVQGGLRGSDLPGVIGANRKKAGNDAATD